MGRNAKWTLGRAISVGLLLLGYLAGGLAGAGEARAQGARSVFGAPTQSSPPRDFFSLLFGISPSRPPSAEPERPRIEITPRRRGEGEGGERYGRGVAIAYCVRTCDGRYFPLQGRPGSAGDPAALAQCNSFCPASKMAVYTSADSAKGIDVAVSKDGKPYSSMPYAFVYRQRLVDGCSCTGSPRIGGLGKVDVMNDPTLKRGDIVMTADGSKVFAGAKSGPPYKQADFVSPSHFPELSGEMRARLRELKVASR